MTHRKKVLLYNPKAVFFDMPLALLAIGSVLDPKKYEVIIVDGRIDENPIALLQQHLTDALCFGVTVITGAPIKDALEISEKVKTLAPELPVIWGGWHTALFATQPIEEHRFIDITVQGQGEDTFKELVDRLDTNTSLEGLKGISFRNGEKAVKNPPRSIVDMDSMPRVNYDLIDVEKYFEKKGKRQFDFISSIGCFFRCAFCADPFVFKRKFSAISPKKMIEDLVYYHDKYKFDDLNFQDETFFTYANRIEEFCTELIASGLKFSWAATMRADQGERLSDEVWELSKKSGLRRLLIGVESGSQEMMDWLKKDIKLTQVFYCADKCKDLGIDVIFPFIVGFPNETPESVNATVDVVKKLGSKSPGFQTPIFYFKPYPGSQITQDVVAQGYKLPETTREWADFDYIGSSGPWVSKEKERFFEAFKFYMKLGYGKNRGAIFYVLRKLGQWRCKKDLFKFPVEKFIINLLRPEKQLS
ncbi:B12-binding domain-containing radical SAM protein [Spongiimicrobium salis]|uniref:B12-binding domain-containing radical SAM protein n=1 Tax=Spongiimicrobium salis TaxID=1667022 RepID=UPI00374D711A